MKIELRKVTDITPYAMNPRLNDAAVDAVARSIKVFGFRQPIWRRENCAMEKLLAAKIRELETEQRDES